MTNKMQFNYKAINFYDLHALVKYFLIVVFLGFNVICFSKLTILLVEH